MNIDWKRKLTSRKFWGLLLTLVVAVLVYVGKSKSEITQITAIITSGAATIAYILGEGFVDAKREENKNDPVH